MTDRSADILPLRPSMGGVSDQLTRYTPCLSPGVERRWLIPRCCLPRCFFLLLLDFNGSRCSHAVWVSGVSNIPVNWAFAIHNYVWWLGIGHAGTLISALLLLTQSEWRNLAQPVRRDDDAVCR